MPSYPIAQKRPHKITQHGQTRDDDFFWMRNREDPALLEYLNAENDYLEEVMQHTKPLQEQLFEEMKARIKEDDESAPIKHGDYFYYTRTATGQQYPYYCRKKVTLNAPEEIILDQNALSKGMAFCRIGAFSVSPDHQKLAYSVDPDGTEKCTLYIKDLNTGEHYPEHILNTWGDVYGHYGIEWANDNQTLFYATLDSTLRPYKIYRHTLGTETQKDALIYHEEDESFFLLLYKSRSQAFIMVYCLSTITSEWHILSADKPQSSFQVFEPRKRGHEYSIEHLGKRFFITSNENALNFKLMQTPIEATQHEHWREVIPHREDVLIQGMDAFKNHLVLYE
ncbi:MAG: oligopeptidase B, partial [Anaerolineales bacterium]